MVLIDSAIETALDQFFSLKKEIRETLGVSDYEFYDCRDRYWLADNDKCYSIDEPFTEENIENGKRLYADHIPNNAPIIKKGKLVLILVRSHFGESSYYRIFHVDKQCTDIKLITFCKECW